MRLTERERRMAAHIEHLCMAFDVYLLVRDDLKPDEAGAGHLIADAHLPPPLRRKAITIAPVIDESTYAVALHELGHCCSPLGDLCITEGSATMRLHNRITSARDVRLKLEEERAAWQWAQHYALDWTPLMQRVKEMGLQSYEAMALRILGFIPKGE